MREAGRDQPLELGDEPMRSLRRKIQAEPLHRGKLVLNRIVRAKDRAERACADLMQNAEWAEGVRRRSTGSFRVQLRYSWRESRRIVTHLVRSVSPETLRGFRFFERVGVRCRPTRPWAS